MTDSIDPRRALLRELISYYHGDELPEITESGLAEQADSSANQMVHVLGDRAREVAVILREMMADRDHALFEPLRVGTLIDWNHDEAAWPRFQRIAQGMIDGIGKRTVA